MRKTKILDTIKKCQKKKRQLNYVDTSVSIEFTGFNEALYNGVYEVNDIWSAGASRRLSSTIDDIMLKMFL